MLSSMILRNAGSRCPTTGKDKACSTRGFTGLGPGPRRVRTGGLSWAATIKIPCLLFRLYIEFHGADFFNRPLQVIAVVELADTGRCAGGDEIPRAQGQAAREKSDVLSDPANHVAGMSRHGFFAILQNFDRKILRFVDFVARHNPRSQAAEGVEAFADVAGIMHSFAPGIPLADIPADGVAENVLWRPT